MEIFPDRNMLLELKFTRCDVVEPVIFKEDCENPLTVTCLEAKMLPPSVAFTHSIVIVVVLMLPVIVPLATLNVELAVLSEESMN